MKNGNLRWQSATILLLIASAAFSPVGADESFPRPHGLYVLDSVVGTTNINGVSMRDANIRTNDFVTGYAHCQKTRPQ